MVKTKVEVNAQSIVLEALQCISLKVGGNFVVIDLMGVSINGTLVNINSGGSAQSTGNPTIEDPLDAAGADNGVPGNLEKAGSGGTRTRNKRTLNSQHGPVVTRLASGNYSIGPGIQVAGADPAYAHAVINDLATIGTTPSGQALLNNLNTSGRTTTIQPMNPPPNPPNAYAQPGNSMPADFQAATPAGQPVFDGSGNPINDAAGNQMVGTGTGADTPVNYNPNQWPDPGTRTQAPGDAILFHEMTHADNMQQGQYDGTPRADNFDTNEEFNTIGPENQYRDERGIPQRTDHHDL
jgi:hypothetical protein